MNLGVRSSVIRGRIVTKQSLTIHAEQKGQLYINQMSLLHAQNQNQSETLAKERVSSATWVSSSEEPLELFESPKSQSTASPPASEFRSELFENTIGTSQVSQKVHQRAVSWMITISWSKSLSQECLWSTLLLYYSYKSKKKLPKEELELTLLTCLSLSLKMTSTKHHSTKELASLSSRDITPAAIVDREELILDLVDYNVVMPHQLEELYSEESCCQDDFEKLLLLTELMMVKDCSIFFDRSKLKALRKLLHLKKDAKPEEEQNAEELKKTKEEVKALLQLKQCGIILKKYSSKFDMEQFKALF